MMRKLIKAGLFVLLLLFALRVLAVTIAPQGGGWTTTKILSIGWIDFLRRNLPEVTLNWSGIALVILCSLVISIGAHWLCKWLHRAVNPEALRSWSWRWTLALVASFWLTFGIVIGASGAARHMKWLAEFDEPLYKERVNYFVDMRMAALELEYLLQEPDADLNRVHARMVTS